MPKRMYNVLKTRGELSRNISKTSGSGPVGEHKLQVLLGGNLRVFRGPTEFPIFEQIDAKLRSKPDGAIATYSKQRKDGRKVDYVFEKRGAHYVLVERRFFPAGSGEPKIEKVAQLKKFHPKK